MSQIQVLGDKWIGRVEDNYEVLGAVDDHSFVVPAGRRWICTGVGWCERDASATLSMDIYNAADELLNNVDTWTAAATNVIWPQSFASDRKAMCLPGLVLDAGMYVKLTFGATQTTPIVAFLVLELDVNVQ